MQDWSHSQQVGDLISVLSEACPFVGIYSEMAEVSTCPGEDWSSAHQQADLVNLFLQVVPEGSSISMPCFPKTCRRLQRHTFRIFRLHPAVLRWTRRSPHHERL